VIWLIGNKGMLGRDVQTALERAGLEFRATDMDVDITDFHVVSDYVSDKDISWIINCAAYTAVDRAEDEPDAASAINARGPGNLAGISADKGARLIHISTDYVYDGLKSGEYLEDDEAAPAGVYGMSKLEGEINIREAFENFFIIRISWLFGTGGGNFVKTMLRLFNERDEVRVVNDQHGSPTYTRDLAEFIIHIIKNDSREFGIYHYSNTGATTWYDFACAIYDLAVSREMVRGGLKIVPVSTDEYKTKAPRPANSVMSKDKARKTFGIEVRTWQDVLADYLDELRHMGKE